MAESSSSVVDAGEALWALRAAATPHSLTQRR